MSKESLKSSINMPEEGVKSAEESNKLKPSINTPEGVNIQNPEPVQDQEQPAPSNSQEEKKTRKILKDDPKLKGTRMARAGAAATALAGATAEAGYHVTAGVVKGVGKIAAHDIVGGVEHIVEGVAKGGSKVATAVSKAADPLDKARKGGKIKEEGQHSPGLYDKALNKIRTSVSGGNTIADGLDKTYKVISSKGTKRILKVGGAISSVALNPTPIGVGIAALSLTAVAYNVTKETLEVREDKKLDREKTALESIKGAKAQQLNKVLEAKENIAKDAPNLQKFLDTKIPDIYKNPPEPSPDKTFEGGWAKQFVKSVRDTTLEAASLFADGIATGSIGGIAFAATAAFVNITGEVDSNIVHILDNAVCGRCYSKKPNYNLARSLFKFNEYSKKVVHQFKYQDKTIFAKTFAKLLCNRYLEDIKDVDLIIAVPMNRFKRLIRMYNPPHILAEEIAKIMNFTVKADILIKSKWTKAQTFLSKRQRKNNISGSIKFNTKHNIIGKKILLVDDVITTGVTINECSKILRAAGAKEVYVVSVAMT